MKLNIFCINNKKKNMTTSATCDLRSSTADDRLRLKQLGIGTRNSGSSGPPLTESCTPVISISWRSFITWFAFSNQSIDQAAQWPVPRHEGIDYIHYEMAVAFACQLAADNVRHLAFALALSIRIKRCQICRQNANFNFTYTFYFCAHFTFYWQPICTHN